MSGYHKHGLWIKLMLYCGLRTGETARVKIAHFDFKKKFLFIDGTKTYNAQRYVPVPDEILEEVSIMWKSFKRAMHIESGGKLYRDSIIPSYMVADDLVPYCLRHTFCTDLQDAGIPINVARDLMGHSDISLTSKIYTHTTDRAISSAAQMLKTYRACRTTIARHIEISTGLSVLFFQSCHTVFYKVLQEKQIPVHTSDMAAPG